MGRSWDARITLPIPKSELKLRNPSLSRDHEPLPPISSLALPSLSCRTFRHSDLPRIGCSRYRIRETPQLLGVCRTLLRVHLALLLQCHCLTQHPLPLPLRFWDALPKAGQVPNLFIPFVHHSIKPLSPPTQLCPLIPFLHT
jgi:hypothetical protein